MSEPTTITEPSPTTRLKNGQDEVTSFIAVIMDAVHKLWDDIEGGGPLCVFDLVQLCKDSSYKPFGIRRDQLAAVSLIDKHADGSCTVHGSIKNIVLSAAVEGDEGNMTLVNPIAEKSVEATS